MIPLPVSRFASSPVHTIRVGATLDEAARRMSDALISSLVVITDGVGAAGHDGVIAGILTRTDLLRAGRLRATMADRPALLSMPHLHVAERMRRDVVTVAPSATVSDAAALLWQRRIHRVVLEVEGPSGRRPTGIFSTRDLLRAVSEARVDLPLARAMTSPVITVAADETLARATEILIDGKLRGVVVVDDAGGGGGESAWPVGLFTQREAMESEARASDTPVEEVMSAALLCLPPDMPLHRAATFAQATRARSILVVEGRRMRGLVTGLDIARVVSGQS